MKVKETYGAAVPRGGAASSRERCPKKGKRELRAKDRVVTKEEENNVSG